MYQWWRTFALVVCGDNHWPNRYIFKCLLKEPIKVCSNDYADVVLGDHIRNGSMSR